MVKLMTFRNTIYAQKYSKYRDKQIIYHVNTKHGEETLSANRNGIKRTERGMHIQKKDDNVLGTEIKCGRIRII